MEFAAVSRAGVFIYSFNPDEAELGPPAQTFPPVPTADSCVWSTDGTLLALADTKSGGVTVYNAAEGYAELCRIPPLIGGPVRNLYFSPMGNFLVTHERWAKDAGNNIGVWDVRTAEQKFSFILKKMTEMTWPPLMWTALETHCCRMVQDGVLIMAGSLQKDDGETLKIEAPGIMAFAAAPRGAGTSAPHCAICIAESKGAPARCQIFRLDSPSKPTATKNFFKAQTVTMQWNNTGSALLCRSSQEVDDTGKSYYGGSTLYFLRADGEENAIVCSPDEGAIHDVQWNPTQDEFFVLHGDLPCHLSLYNGSKGTKKVDFGQGHRNTIRWNTFGRFLVLGGHGQLVGDTDFWDKPGKKLLGTVRMETCVVCGWAPDGRHFLGATTAPRMRVDNKVEIYNYCGERLRRQEFEELLFAGWRPRPRGAFQDRPPSPGRSSAAAGSKAPGAAAAAKPKQQAYRPPAARGAGGGGLAEALRKELGSTQAGASTMATKVGLGGPTTIHNLPPGACAEDLQPKKNPASASSARKPRKKKPKDGAKADQEDKDEEEDEEKAPAPAAKPPPAKAVAAVAASSEEKGAATSAAPASGGGGGAGTASENPEIEKRVRALRKKLRDIEKLKEKPVAELDPLQKTKIAGEPEIIQQIRDLGAEP